MGSRDRDDRNNNRRSRREHDDDALYNAPPRGIISACAHPGHGKTTWLLTAPKPIDLIYVDVNTPEIVKKEIAKGTLKKSDIRLHKFDYPTALFGDQDLVQDRATEIWEDQIRPAFEAIVDDESIEGTIGVDTATELRETQMLMHFGKLIQIPKQLYTKPNAQFKGILATLKNTGRNVVLLHRLKDVYETVTKRGRGRDAGEEVDEKVPGVYQREGFNKTGYLVNAEVFLMFDRTRHEKINRCYGMEVMRSTQRPAMIGEKWWGMEKQDDDTLVKRASFPYLMTQLYPDTTLEDWL